MSTFKPYSEKSKARRALVQVHKRDDADDYLTQVDGKWGFYMEGGFPVIEDAFAQPLADLEPVASEILERENRILESFGYYKDLASKVTETANAIVATTMEQFTTDTDPLQEEPQSAFGAFCFGQLTASTNGKHVEPENGDKPVRTTTASTKGQKIEKDRAIQNGVQIPSAGTLCRAVWDTLSSMLTHDEGTGLANVPTAKEIKEVAIKQGWNLNNASIEYYRWRKFNGITGHGKKTV